MVYGCGNSMLKSLMFITNFLIFLIGGVIFGFSLWANLDNNFGDHLKEFLEKANLGDIGDEILRHASQFHASLWVLVGIGALLLLVGFFGCCGAGCENKLLLSLFSVVVLVLAIIQLFALVFFFMNRPEFIAKVQEGLVKSSETSESRFNLVALEKALNCCGATAENKFKYKQEGLCPGDLADAPDCFSVIKELISSFSTIIGISGVTLLVVELFALIFSCVLLHAFNEYERNSYSYTY